LRSLFIAVLFFMCYAIGHSQSNTVQYAQMRNADLMWLKSHEIDLTEKEDIQIKLRKNLKEVFEAKNTERQKRSQVAAFAALGTMGIVAGLTNAKTTFRSQSVNSIMSAAGIISSGIAFKKFFERKNASKELKQRIDLCKAQYDLIVKK